MMLMLIGSMGMGTKARSWQETRDTAPIKYELNWLIGTIG